MVMGARRAVSVAGDGGRLSLMGGDQVADDGSVAFAVAVDGDDKRCGPGIGGGWEELRRWKRADFD